MRSRTTTKIALLVLAICLLCPLVDMFDYWDHMPQTGNDTEYTLVILGLCVGALFTFAHTVFIKREYSRANNAAAIESILQTFFLGSPISTVKVLASASPPPATLRI